MAEPRLYDFLYFSIIFCFICGDLPFLVTQKTGSIHIVKNKWTKLWYIFNSLINVFLVISMAVNTRTILLFFRERQVNSYSMVFILSKFIMLLYLTQRLFRRGIMVKSSTDLWEELMKFDKNCKLTKEIHLRKLTIAERLKLVVLLACNFMSNFTFCVTFGIPVYGICWFQYISMLFSSLLYVYHVLYILIAELIEKLRKDLEVSEGHQEIRKLAAAFGDIIVITRKTNDYLSFYIYTTFSFVGVQMVVYTYSLFKFSEGNSVFVAISVVAFISSFVFLSVGWFILLAENCQNKVKQLKKALYVVSLRSKDLCVLKEVKLFSLQLLHDEFKVTGAGFFEINLKLMLNYLSTTVMYVVLLVQTDEAVCTIINGFLGSL